MDWIALQASSSVTRGITARFVEETKKDNASSVWLLTIQWEHRI
jgi:hypothetical protein